MAIISAHNPLFRTDISVPKKKGRIWILLITSTHSQRWNDLPSLSLDKKERIALSSISSLFILSLTLNFVFIFTPISDNVTFLCR